MCLFIYFDGQLLTICLYDFRKTYKKTEQSYILLDARSKGPNFVLEIFKLFKIFSWMQLLANYFELTTLGQLVVNQLVNC